MSERHSGLSSSNLQFRRNPFSTLEPINEIESRLGSHAAPLEVAPTSSIGVEYTTSGEWKYDDKRLEEIRNGLIDDLGKLNIKTLHGLESDLVDLKLSVKAQSANNFQKTYPKQLNRLFRLMPYLYDSQGSPIWADLSESNRNGIVSQIKSASPMDLSNRYLDLFQEQKNSLEPVFQRINDGSAKSSLQGVESQFIERQVRPGVQPVSLEHGAISTRTITLEELSSSVAVFRGCKGGDCSILSVPYYPLVKGTKTYWVRKSADFSAQPDGYVFVASIERNGRKIPYIVTVNGVTLTQSDVQKVVQLVAKDWNTTEVIVPDFSVNKHVVNTDQIRRGLSSDGGEDVKVQLPPGWSEVEKYQNEHNHGYTNYYQEDKISSARLIKVPNSQKDILRWVNPPKTLYYQPPREVEKLSLVERALLSAHATANSGSTQDKATILESLKIGEKELSLGKSVLDVSPQTPMSGALYDKIHEGLGYQVKDLENFDALTRPYSIGRLYLEKPSLASEAKWKTMASRASDEIDHQLVGIEDREDALLAALEAKNQLPAALVPNRFDAAVPFLEPDKPKMRSTALKVLAKADQLPEALVKKIAEHYSPNAPDRSIIAEIAIKHGFALNKEVIDFLSTNYSFLEFETLFLDDLIGKGRIQPTDPEYKLILKDILSGPHTYTWITRGANSESAYPKAIEATKKLPVEERASYLDFVRKFPRFESQVSEALAAPAPPATVGDCVLGRLNRHN